MGVSVGPIECRFDGASAAELAIDSSRRQFTRSRRHLSADETNYVLAAIRARHDVQLGRTARMVCDTRLGRLGRMLAALHGRRLLDHRVRHHLRASGN